ncbi:MAG: DUF1501 domain-containing protein [Verrucomicrobiales bacterium]|nr:DUF1501 domain-containing protein [Verrucomicrobiales bacterium]
MNRRNFLHTSAAGLSAFSWMTPMADALALNATQSKSTRPKSVIILWLAGGPSQLETFDPHPGSSISYGTKSIPTAVKGMNLAAGLEQSAEVMNHVSLIRSVTSKEGDHERAFYNIKTGYRPNPTVVHPSIGSILCHQLPNPKIEIPSHISILPNQWPARGGYLGAQYDAFQMGDPKQPVPDVIPHASSQRQKQRRQGLSLIESSFAKGRLKQLDEQKTHHLQNMANARKLMQSDQLKAFDVSQAPKAERLAYGDTRFGRACFAALRLVEAGVRCIEVTLSGWDSHANNHESQGKRIQTLDPAFAALIKDLKRRDLLDSTTVLCGGEFGRTPQLNAAEGRDHWPKGFSMAIAGGGIQGGRIIGATDPSGEKEQPVNPVRVQDIHATIQHQMGIDFEEELITPVGRPIALSDGSLIEELL